MMETEHDVQSSALSKGTPNTIILATPNTIVLAIKIFTPKNVFIQHCVSFCTKYIYQGSKTFYFCGLF